MRVKKTTLAGLCLLFVSTLAAAAAGDRYFSNPTLNKDVVIQVNKAGVTTDALKVTGSTGAVNVGGAFTGAGTLTLTAGSLNIGTGESLNIKNSGGVARQVVTIDGSNNTSIGGTADGGIKFYGGTGNERGSVTSAGLWTLGPSTGNLLHVVNGNLDVQMRAANQNSQFISTSGYSLVTTGNGGGGGTGGAWGTANAGFFSGVANGDIISYTAGSSMWFSANGSSTQGQLTNAGVWKNAAGTWTVSSDKRLKKNIVTMDGALDRINALHPVTFDWIEDKPAVSKPRAGFIAQEVEKVMPGIVRHSPYTYKKDGQEVQVKDAKHLDLGSEMFANLVQAIQELSAENKALKFRLTALEADRRY